MVSKPQAIRGQEELQCLIIINIIIKIIIILKENAIFVINVSSFQQSCFDDTKICHCLLIPARAAIIFCTTHFYRWPKPDLTR